MRYLLLIVFFLSLRLSTTVHSQTTDLDQKIYLPVVANGNLETLPLIIEPIKGLAMAHSEFPEDLKSLNVSWWYNWGPGTQTNQIPMSRDGSIIPLPDHYSGYVLLFNEPNNVEPYGAPLNAQTAVDRYQAMKTLYPDAKIVVGGVSAWDSVYYGSWLLDFIQECKLRNEPLPNHWALHGYVEGWITARQLEQWWTAQHDLTGGTIWMTEYGVIDGNLSTFQELTSWINRQPWIERYAAFTNRQKGNEPWFISGWEGVSLLTWDGTLTEIGQWYAGR